MASVLRSYRFGPHRVEVVEQVDDEGSTCVWLVVDGTVVTEPPLTSRPDLEEVVRIYAFWREST